MDYLRTVNPSQLIAERGASFVVINPGSANVRIGLADQKAPFSAPHCIARYVKTSKSDKRQPLQDKMLNSTASPAQQSAREKAYDLIATLLKIPYLDEETTNHTYPRKMVRVDGYNSQNNKSNSTFTWANVMVENSSPSLTRDISVNKDGGDSFDQSKSIDEELNNVVRYKFKDFICGEDALRISPSQPYCLRHPIRRGHLNVSQNYTLQGILEDISTIWDWILNEKLNIAPRERSLYSAILVIPETFDSREIKEIISIALRDLGFSSAVVYQEGLAAAFGNGLSTACVVNIGAQVTSVVCIEDGVALPSTSTSLFYGGEDISRCLLWVQQRHHTWPIASTNPLVKPIDMVMLNKVKESYCQVREGEFDAVAIVNSFEEGMPVGSHKIRLSALNVPPMGLFYPTLFLMEEYPPPPRSWFHDYEDMLDDTYHVDFPRRPDMADGQYYGNVGLSMWDNNPTFSSRPPKEDNIGLAEAITNSILSMVGRIDLQRKLFCSIQLIGGVALTSGLVAAVEERVLQAIPSNEAIDTVEVLQTRMDPSFISWKGGAILSILDLGRDGWIHKEDWIRNGIHIGSGRKFKDSLYLQAQALCYINS